MRDRGNPSTRERPVSCADRPQGGLLRMGFAQERTLCAIALIGIPSRERLATRIAHRVGSYGWVSRRSAPCARSR